MPIEVFYCESAVFEVLRGGRSAAAATSKSIARASQSAAVKRVSPYSFLHIVTYDRMAAEKHSRTGELARSIYQKYLSLRTGCCVFIPSKIRQEVGMRVKSLGSIPDPHIFSSVKPYVDAFLRGQHEQFVCSEEFIDAFNQICANKFNFMSSGRRIFATILCKKLNREQTCRRRNDEIERQLRDIEDRKCTARELISTADAVEVDDEDDVERYVERMREDSLKASANRTPHTNTLSPRMLH
uniref:RGS domain-containing protein n=1 Tax=Heterorhabditis bacteriophora TaxID=37862 RepID=A0A1I7WZE8_HETBA